MVTVEEIGDDVPPSQERLLDAQEIEKVAATLTRPTARMQLESLAKKLRKESEALKRVEASRKKSNQDGPATSASSSAPSPGETTTKAQTAATTTTATPAAIPKTTPAAAPPVVSGGVALLRR